MEEAATSRQRRDSQSKGSFEDWGLDRRLPRLPRHALGETRQARRVLVFTGVEWGRFSGGGRS